jgi:hypothetical protein
VSGSTRPLAGAAARWLDQPAPAERLAAFRILLGLFTVGYLLIRLPVFLNLAEGRPGRFEPVGLLAPLNGPLPPNLVRAVIVIAVVSGVGFIVGARFAITGPTLAAAMLVLGTYRSSWGQLLHFENLMVLHLLVIGLSPAADRWSLDQRRRSDSHLGRATIDARYGWPLRLAALITVVTYMLAGVAKLRYGGLDWLFGDTLINHVAYSATRLDVLGGRPSPLAGPFTTRGWLATPLAVATVVIELGAPIALLGGVARRAWVAAAWLMHAAILALMFIVFPYPLAGLAFAPLYRLETLPKLVRRSDRRCSAGTA